MFNFSFVTFTSDWILIHHVVPCVFMGTRAWIVFSRRRHTIYTRTTLLRRWAWGASLFDVRNRDGNRFCFGYYFVNDFFNSTGAHNLSYDNSRNYGTSNYK